MNYLVLTLITTCLVSTSPHATACVRNIPGEVIKKEDLIENAHLIMHVKLNTLLTDQINPSVLYKFDVLEVLKGRPYKFWMFDMRKTKSQQHQSNGNADQSLLVSDMDRIDNSKRIDTSKKTVSTASKISTLLQERCKRPVYPFESRAFDSFEVGTEYLIFPGPGGTMHSAEIIQNQNDRWLKFVRDELKYTKLEE